MLRISPFVLVSQTLALCARLSRTLCVGGGGGSSSSSSSGRRRSRWVCRSRGLHGSERVALTASPEPPAAPNISPVPPAHMELEDLAVPGGKLAFVVHGVLSAAESQALIDFSEQRGYDIALVNVGGGKQMRMEQYRNSDRCLVDDARLADALFARLRPFLPTTFPFQGQALTAVGLNERLRFLRYRPGQRFVPHRDGSYVRTPTDVQGRPELASRVGERSLVTVQLYLRNAESGGTTRLLEGDSQVDVPARVGSALVFQHDVRHEGSVVHAGVKYTIRTDLMFAAPAA